MTERDGKKSMIGSMHFSWIRIAMLSLLLLPFVAAEEVIPANNVGYLKHSMQANQLDLVSWPFTNGVNENQVTNLFPTIGSDCDVYFWDTGLQAWTIYPTGVPSPSRELIPGEAFFLHSYIDQEFTFHGIIPSPLMTNTVSDSPCMLAYPYGIEILWTNTQLSNLLPEGSIVSFWNMGSNCWHPTFLKAPTAKGGGWGATANTYTIPAAKGFAIIQPPSGTNFNWVE